MLPFSSAALALIAILMACDPAAPAPAEPIPDELITPNDEFFVINKGARPEVDAATWRLVIDGAVTDTAEISLADLHALGSRERMETLACGGATPAMPWIGNANWSGRPLTEILEAFDVTVTGQAIELQTHGADAYIATTPVTDLTEVWVVWEMNGVPLPPEHGHPARLLVPGVQASKAVKWPVRITFGTEHLPGYWEERYPDFVDDPRYQPICFFTSPEPDAELERETVELRGNAFCGSSTVVLVEVSTNDGDTWQEAEITYPGPANVWTLWRHQWTPAHSGSYTPLVRIECADGQRSDAASSPIVDWSGYGWVEVTVR